MWIDTRPRRSALLAALFGLAALVVLPGASQAQTVVEAARAALPEATRASGVLRTATSLQWPPFGYKSEAGEVEGIDIRLITLLAGKLGLKPEFDDIKFPSIVPGVANGRYDVGVNQIGVTAERMKVADFLPYFNSGYGLLVRRGATDIDINRLCGKTLALTQGSAQIAVAEQLSAACVKSGQKEIAFLFFPNSADTYLALSNGRGDGFMTAKAVGIYIAKGNPKLDMTTSTLADSISTSGIVIAKGNEALRTALRLALESAVTDGSYQKILADFGVPDGALSVEQIRNPLPPS
ncbi:transporter substrate-binding domain-containing protein [Bosea sp. LjRoot9]|uniref:transporter substrate-binding domain-containing protein n=1 Tax=Bosea sp. LjRoot9 TaxID=3342341 RepID=UPI003ECF3E40